jgi:flavin-dependent dehydrogenase
VDADVLVVGGGTAGLAVARAAARRGLGVRLLERGPLEDAGAQWVNGVPDWCFDEGDLPRPQAPERRGPCGAVHLIVGWGPDRVVVPHRDTAAVDMRLLGARLRGDAVAAGAHLEGGVSVTGLDADGVVATSRGPVRARYVVDASGLGGAGLLPLSPVARGDLCVAAQEVRRVVDRAAAAEWARENGVAEGDHATFTSVAGGYSIVSVHWVGDEVSILTGSVPADGVPAGTRLLADFVARHPWIGERLFGGSRAIPLRPPRLRLADGSVALIGDAACQVYGAHGSGIGAQLVAARLLADCLADGRGTAGYAAEWLRRHGGELAASAIFARFARTLSTADLGRLVGSGLLGAWSARPTMEQRPTPFPPLAELRRIAGAVRAERAIVRRVAPVLGRMAMARAVFRLHAPGARWERLAARVARG